MAGRSSNERSGSGLLLPSIASALRAAAQVYIAALIPDGARSFRDELIADPHGVVHPGWVGVRPTVDVDTARHFLFHDCDEAVSSWAMTTLRRFLPSAWTTK